MTTTIMARRDFAMHVREADLLAIKPVTCAIYINKSKKELIKEWLAYPPEKHAMQFGVSWWCHRR